MHEFPIDEFDLPMFGVSLAPETVLPPEPAFEAELGEDLGHMRLDMLAMTTLLRSLSFALLIRSVELVLKEKDAGPSSAPMSPEDWVSYV